ncbi:DUF3037 domain-containing protein [Vreelandella titanicae]|uniref:DUF3037 domain-containing protein n=1 Tax=Vreelandella titanicae TaxID=664683 RepID=UPI0039889009|tara:strand:+ start:110 stop:943 length:834 start_codon:yes stop_codon:yes gene_type:complete
MSTIICNYAVLRFQPYPDTGEFINLGIVMLTSDGLFLERVETRARQRVTHFFAKLPRDIFTSARRDFVSELKRVALLANKHQKDRSFQLELFKYLTGPSETMFRFSRPGTFATDDAHQAIDELFNRYVHHDFSQQLSKEARLTSRVSHWLKSVKDRRYRERSLGGDLLKVKFPLVWEEEGITKQAVKPISFDLEDASSIIEKGDKWEARLRRLKESGQAPVDTVFITHAPETESGARQRAYTEIYRELTGTGLIRIVPDTLGQSNIIKSITAGAAVH